MLPYQSSATAGTAGVFRVRAECSDPKHEELLLAFLRRNGHFAYPVADAVETVCVGTAPGALRELLADVERWLESEPDAAVTIELVGDSIVDGGRTAGESHASPATAPANEPVAL